MAGPVVLADTSVLIDYFRKIARQGDVHGTAEARTEGPMRYL